MPGPTPDTPDIPPDEGAALPQGVNDEEWELDATDTEPGGNWELVPEGRHAARIIKVDFGPSKAGKDMYTWEFRILDEAGDLTIRYWTSVDPSVRWRVAELLEAIGMQAYGSVVRFKRSDVLGKTCAIVVEHGPRNDDPTKTTHNVVRAEALEDDEIKKFATTPA